jgi:ribonucleoside-diphosphate reductase alpha chain
MVQTVRPAGVEQFPSETLEFFGEDELRIRCFLDKYALKDPQGRVVEKTPQEMWQRVAREIAGVEATTKDVAEWQKNFYWLLEDFRFIPGGRIMFGAGQPRNATLLNCYVIPIHEDSLDGIFEWCRQAARTYSFGGGVGTDISVLRPRGAPVNNSAIYSTGSVSFMDLFSTTTGTIGQAGRRGALMITVRVDHPDVLDFIEVKNDPERRKVQYANVSVRLTDEFMKAVEAGREYTLHYENEIVGHIEKRVSAREIWERLIKNAHASAEPGLIFWDNIQKYSTTEYNGMEVITTNPCSEIPLEPYGCCCLGNVNLARFVQDEYTNQSHVDWVNLGQALRYATRFLDNVLDYNSDKHPLPQQKEASLKSRRIGVGFTGFGDMLIKLGYKYDTAEAIAFTDGLFDQIKNIVYETSTELAVEKGSFAAYDYQKHMKSAFIGGLSKEVKGLIKKRGLRNAALLTVPPVGSGSVLAGTTSGVEPIFSLSYLRKSKSLSKEEFQVDHPLVHDYMESKGLRSAQELPALFVTAHEIKPEFRVQMQATIQKHIDHAISSTVNLAREITPEEVGKIYLLAWQLGCKGITVYREGSREGILLTEKEAQNERRGVRAPRPRPQVTRGKTFKMKTEMGNMYITVNEDERGMFEVFANLGKSGSSAMAFTEAIGRLISLALRSGVKPTAVIDELSLIRGLRPVVQDDGVVVFSVPDAVAKAMEAYLRGGEQLALLDEVKPQSTGHHLPEATSNGRERKRSAELCPTCGGLLLFTNGCYICSDCGFSECD